MVVLVASLSTGKGTWGHVSRLIKEGSFDKTFLITNDFGRENFKAAEGNIEYILIDVRKPIKELAQDIMREIKGKIDDKEVVVNIISGTGKEHTAILSALTQLRHTYRFTALTKNGIEAM